MVFVKFLVMKHHPTYSRDELIERLTATTDLEELHGLAQLFLEEALLYGAEEYTELAYLFSARSVAMIPPLLHRVEELRQIIERLTVTGED